jgi:hypothetical protein
MPQTTSRCIPLFSIAAEEIDEFGKFLRLIPDIAAPDRIRDAMGGVILQNLLLDALERRFDRLLLG